MTAFLLAALATWRLAKMLGQERMPFKFGADLRLLFGGIVAEEDGSPAYELDGSPVFHAEAPEFVREIGRGMLCLWCCSIWVAAVVALFMPRRAPYGITVLALSASAMIIEREFNREDESDGGLGDDE